MISPLLANLYLHWFDRMFHRCDGPYQWANARLVRYADDFVIMARYVGGRIVEFVEQTLQGRFGLTVNREKTRTVKLNEPGESLDFLGYTFRYDRDLQGRPWRYLNVCPSSKSMQRERDKLREMTGPEMCFMPITALIEQINDCLLYTSGRRRRRQLQYGHLQLRFLESDRGHTEYRHHSHGFHRLLQWRVSIQH